MTNQAKINQNSFQDIAYGPIIDANNNAVWSAAV